jgi:hypothetical protein
VFGQWIGYFGEREVKKPDISNVTNLDFETLALKTVIFLDYRMVSLSLFPDEKMLSNSGTLRHVLNQYP